MRMGRRILLLCTTIMIAMPLAGFVYAQEEVSSATAGLAPHARSAILMDAETGHVIYEKNTNEKLPPASITKIMSMLLIMEALDEGKITWEDKVSTSEFAASMGGSQIFLEPGEEMTVSDMLKGIAMASGNDATVAMAEKIAGSEPLFVEQMNARAKQLGMKNTHFANTNGLPAKDHYTTAYDIALMSRELLKHEQITEYTKKYEDYLRKDSDKPFWLVNTNKLVRFYNGVDGLKTGYTSEAKYCLSATAKRDDFRVIAVVLGEPDTKTRNAEVTAMFNYAFSQYMNVPILNKGELMGTVDVVKGKKETMTLTAERRYSLLVKKGEVKDGSELRHELVMNGPLKAPLEKGQPIGKLVVYHGDKVAAEFEVVSPGDVGKAGWWTFFKRTLSKVAFQ